MSEVLAITAAVVGACGLALWLMLRPGSIAHRARQAEQEPPPGADRSEPDRRPSDGGPIGGPDGDGAASG